MKISKIILFGFLAVIAFASCNKDKDKNNNPASIEGRWVGTYLNDATNQTYYFSFNIKPGGIIEEINSSNQKLGEGTWQLDNSTNVFMAQYSWTAGGSFSVIAAFNKNQAKLIGDWGFGSSNTNGGTWEMTKSN
jgi:hypothetical protein